MGNFSDKLKEYKKIRDKYIEEYKNIKKEKISLIGKGILITVMMVTSSLIIANTLNLACGVCTTIVLYIPLSKTCKQLDILRQKQKEIKRNLPTIDALINDLSKAKKQQLKKNATDKKNTIPTTVFSNNGQQVNPTPVHNQEPNPKGYVKSIGTIGMNRRG